jgi:hypothetical protein
MKAIDSATAAGMQVHSRYCEGDHCCEPNGEVRVYPLLFAARVILCHACWERENRYRYGRGKELGCPEHWLTRDWEAAQRYKPLRLSAEANAIAGPRCGSAAKRGSASETGSPASLVA